MKSSIEIQEDIITNFSLFEEDKESALFYLMDLGKKLRPMPDNYKTDEHLIKGCMSKVWLHASMHDGKIVFEADSNTDITRGLISLLVSVWDNRTPEEILQSELFFIDKIGMGSMVGSQRNNGFASMIKQMKMYAIAFQTEANHG